MVLWSFLLKFPPRLLSLLDPTFILMKTGPGVLTLGIKYKKIFFTFRYVSCNMQIDNITSTSLCLHNKLYVHSHRSVLHKCNTDLCRPRSK